MRPVVAFAAVVLFTASARAEEAPAAPPAPPSSTAHRHLGFYLNLATGVGGMGLWTGGTSFGGGGSGGDLSIGGAVAEDLILAGHLWSYEQFGTNAFLAGSSPQLSDSRAAVGGIGLELRRYFMPANLFVSVTPALAVANVRTPAKDDLPGFGVQVAAGKEWWVSDHWGLGVAAKGFGAWCSGDGVSASGYGGAIAFTATYN